MKIITPWQAAKAIFTVVICVAAVIYFDRYYAPPAFIEEHSEIKKDGVDYSFNSYKVQLVLTDSCVFLGDSASKDGNGIWRTMTPVVFSSGRWKVYVIEVPDSMRMPFGMWSQGLFTKEDSSLVSQFKN